MSPEDRQKYIAGLVARGGAKIDPDDPSFELVILNRLMLEDAGAIFDQVTQNNVVRLAQAMAQHVVALDGRIEQVSATQAGVANLLRELAEHAEKTHVSAAKIGAETVKAEIREAAREAVQAEIAASGEVLRRAVAGLDEATRAAVQQIMTSAAAGAAVGKESAEAKIFWCVGAGIVGAAAMFSVMRLMQ